MRIYVGNLTREINEDDLRSAFEKFCRVESVTIMKDKFTGISKGFAFVDIPSKEEGLSAIEGLNDKELMGKTIQVNEARPRTDHRSNFGRWGDNRGAFNDGNSRSNRGGGGFGGKKRYGGNKGRRGSNR